MAIIFLRNSSAETTQLLLSMEYTASFKPDEQYKAGHHFVAAEHIRDLKTAEHAFPDQSSYISGKDYCVDMEIAA